MGPKGEFVLGLWLIFVFASMSSSKNCVRCGVLTTFCCAGCERVPYCSTGCQDVDWHRGHKFICAPALEDMLRLRFKLRCVKSVNHPELNPDWVDLSTTCINFFVYEKGKEHIYSTSIDRNILHICVCCGDGITKIQHDKMFAFQKNGMKVKCHRCEECQNKNKVIFQTTFRETGKCANINKERASMFLFLAKQPEGDFAALPKDIVSLILGVYSNVVCCR